MARHRRRKRRFRLSPAWLLLCGLCVAVGVYGVAVPLALWSADESAWRQSFGTLGEALRLHTLQALAVLWVFSFGACIGSFLNVVIYRVPRGRTLLGRSQCPYCCHEIRMRHNIPILGWLLLRGRCFDCRLPISARYPLIETVVATIFLTLAAIELFSGGRNLPVRVPNFYAGIEWIVFAPQWDLIHVYALHCSLFTVLLSWALIWYDGQRVPIAYGLLALASVLVLPVVAPHVLIVSWNPLTAVRWPMLPAEAWLTAVIGAIVGGLIGTTLGATHRIMDGAFRARKSALCFALLGAALGWQAALSTALLLPLVRSALRAFRGRWAESWPIAAILAAWLHIVSWKWLASVPAWPSHVSDPLLAPIQLVVAVYLCALAAGVNSSRRNVEQEFAELNAEYAPSTPLAREASEWERGRG